MGKTKVIIIDDEQSARNVLTNLLERTSNDIVVVASCSNLEEGVEQIKKLQPNVVFLDVQMPNYAGYEIINFFKKINFEIIFVTAYDEYAIRAFELNAIDFLVKPVDRNKLKIAVNKLQDKLHKESELEDYKELLKTIKSKNYKKIIIPELGNRRIINLDSILAIQADGAYSKIFLKENKPLTTSKNLRYFEEVLPKESSFFRSHRAWIINFDYVESLNKTTQNIILANKKVIAKIARARIEDFEKKISYNL